MNVPISRTELTKEEKKIVQSPLDSGWLVQGPYVKKFEEKFSRFTNAKEAIAVTSCTSALHLSLAALEIVLTSKQFGFTKITKNKVETILH